MRDINSNLLRIFNNYLTGRTLDVVIGGQSSQMYPIEASVPQGSVLGPVLWNTLILRKHPEIKVYANDNTLFVLYQCEGHDAAAPNMNSKLQAIYECGSQWQVRFTHSNSGNGYIPLPRCIRCHGRQNPNEEHRPTTHGLWSKTVV